MKWKEKSMEERTNYLLGTTISLVFFILAIFSFVLAVSLGKVIFLIGAIVFLGIGIAAMMFFNNINIKIPKIKLPKLPKLKKKEQRTSVITIAEPNLQPTIQKQIITEKLIDPKEIHEEITKVDDEDTRRKEVELELEE